MKSTGLGLIALLILHTLWLVSSRAAENSSPRIKEEVTRQESIIRGVGERRDEGYTIDRSLVDYTQILPSEFDRALANLGPTDRWLDIGAGEGQAILDYYSPGYDLTHMEGRERRGRKAQAVAMSIEDRRTPLWHLIAGSLGANQIQYLLNRRLREYSSDELGQFQVITDVVGGFSYSENLSLFMEKALSFLRINGSFFTLLQDVHSEYGANRPYYANSPFLTEISKSDGSEVKVCSWLKSISCAVVTCELKMPWRPPIEVYHIQKVCNEVKVPALAQIDFQAGTPPQRRYQLR